MHERCCSHTLNLIATVDYKKIIVQNRRLNKQSNGIIFGTLCRRRLSSFRHFINLISSLDAFEKCNFLWKKSNRASTAKLVKNHTGCYLRTPVVTRWNSVYDSVKHLMEFKAQFNDIYADVGTEHQFSETDIHFLENYITIMKPIATYIDHLQVRKIYTHILASKSFS